MARTVALGQQFFDRIRKDGIFYVDKTDFIREWWRSKDTVSLILRPRRFGKTLMLSTVEQFFSVNNAGRGDLFEGLKVWNDAEMRALQGTLPVVFLSLADVKPSDPEGLLRAMNSRLAALYDAWRPVLGQWLVGRDLAGFDGVACDMDVETAKQSLRQLSGHLFRCFGRKVVVLLDEYDAPMIEAWTKGFWDVAAEFMRGFLNATFKTNPYLERGLMTGVTRVGKESVFSDLNNLNVCSVTSDQYATSFGFTEAEVFAAMDEYGLGDRDGVKRMYDGFCFGKASDIYNPWSVIGYLRSGGELEPWWANTSSNALVGELVRKGGVRLKRQFGTLLEGGTITAVLEDRIAFGRLEGSPDAVWTLLVAAGYLKPVARAGDRWELRAVNGEVRVIFDGLVREWFSTSEAYGDFLSALMRGDLDDMNEYMNDVAADCFSFFDTGGGQGPRTAGSGHVRGRGGKDGPERFYHGFVLGLVVDLRGRYFVTSNLESGSGRYDVMLEPRDPARDDAFIFEFKVHRPGKERTLGDTVASALAQIEEKGYARRLVGRGIPAERIRRYGFAFRGKEVLIG